MKLFYATLLAAILAASGVSAAVAQPPVGPASISINQSNVKLGDYVTFSVTAPKSKFDKRIQVLCEQAVPFDFAWPDGSMQTQADPLVFAMAGSWDYAFLLGGSMSVWYMHDGPASCHADLYYWSYNGEQRFNLLASVSFEAAGR